jgi:hypothetical protein
MKKITPEIILTAIALPFLVWVVTSIFNLQASSGNIESDIKEIKENVKFISEYLITK